jgi:hypothetical protein
MTADTARSRPERAGARLLAAAVAAVFGLLAAAPCAPADPPGNDSFSSPFNAAVNSFPVTLGSTAEATYQASEPLTPDGLGTCDGRKMIATTWYRILGNGGVVSVNTSGSSFDTVIGVYPAPTPVFDVAMPCNDDAPGAGLTSGTSFPSVAGAAYLIQVGGCNACGGSSTPTGSLVLNITATDPPIAPPPPPVIVPPPPPPPDADGDGIPENGQDKCPGVKPTRDVNKDGCQDKPKRILSDLSYDFRYLRRGSAIRGIRLSLVKLTRAPKGARVSVTCTRCVKPGLHGYSFTTKRVGTQPMSPLNGVQLLRGARLTVVVTRSEQLGRRIVVTMGARRDVVKLSCLAVGSRTRSVPCSTGS